MNGGKLIQRGSRGGVKTNVILVIAAIIVGVLLAAKLGPVYGAKWDLEDYMESLLMRFSSLEEDGVFNNLQDYVEKHNIPVRSWEDCNFDGYVGEPGTLTCDYSVNVNFYNIHTYKWKVHAEARLTKIPYDSF